MFTHLVFRTDISLGADSASKQQRGFGGGCGGRVSGSSGRAGGMESIGCVCVLGS